VHEKPDGTVTTISSSNSTPFLAILEQGPDAVRTTVGSRVSDGTVVESLLEQGVLAALRSPGDYCRLDSRLIE
jgi:hypothetical protein